MAGFINVTAIGNTKGSFLGSLGYFRIKGNGIGFSNSDNYKGKGGKFYVKGIISNKSGSFSINNTS
jgi:hypothetical protein